MIAKSPQSVGLYVLAMDDIEQIKSLERVLIREFDPPWNIQKG